MKGRNNLNIGNSDKRMNTDNDERTRTIRSKL